MLGRIGKAMKDGALGVAIKTWANERYGDYGEIREVEVDTQAARIVIKVMMRGEREVIAVTIDRYALIEDGGKLYLRIDKLTTSREWITRLLNRLLDGRRFALPASVGKIL
ncbi:hypothetical protein [Sinimarinibacterium thermocellulolyticum]|uniref:Uncharacterized protein n=1 Tax=Sinimarinibacterium thermocellulolyticum TaxID=3170016 RepID=A0ABV2A7Y0_9GAMM